MFNNTIRRSAGIIFLAGLFLITTHNVFSQSQQKRHVVTAVAGTEQEGTSDGDISVARFKCLTGIAVGKNGAIYVADQCNSAIRKIKDGKVSTLVGRSRPFKNDSKIQTPSKLVVDKQGNIFCSDLERHSIYKVTPDGIVTVYAGSGTFGYQDGPAETAKFNTPGGLAIDKQGNLFVADYNNQRIRKIDPKGNVTTVAGDGTDGSLDGTLITAQFSYPQDIVIDAEGNLYIADSNNHRIRKISKNGIVTTLAGAMERRISDKSYVDGMGSKARFYWPSGVAIDPNGNIYVADQFNGLIRKVTKDGNVSTLAGNEEGIHAPIGVAVDKEGNVYVVDRATVKK